MKELKSIKKWMLFIIAVMFLSAPFNAFGQEESAPAPEKKKEKPVRSPFQASTLIESQSYVVFPKKTLVFDMQHRFGKMNSESFDLLGIYGASNIRMGLTYVVLEKFQLGVGTTKNKLLQDINWKYSILTQTRSNSMPIAMTYYGNWVYDARDKENFGFEYKASNRMSYFNQLIIGRKFGKSVAVQLMANYSHFNQIDTISGDPETKHDNFGIGVAGRIKFSPQGSILLEYEAPLTTPEAIKPNLSFGVEFATSAHAFQIFVTTYNGIMYQHNLTQNTNDFGNGDFLLGFNFTRNWGW